MGAPVEPVGRKAKLPKAGPGEAAELCRPPYRLLCRECKERKRRSGCDHLPAPPFLSPSTFHLSLPPPSSLIPPSSPRCPVPLGPPSGPRADLASAHQSPGTGVGASCRRGGSERRWGVPGLGERPRERGMVVSPARPEPGSLCPSTLPILAASNAHPEVERGAGGCG